MKERAVIVANRPKWVKEIVEGRKLYEIRKSCPDIWEAPLTVYIYCTKSGKDPEGAEGYQPPAGRVIGEFTLRDADVITPLPEGVRIGGARDKTGAALADACLSAKEVADYLGESGGYAWKIENLKVYEKPLLLGTFGVKRAPQSWQYAEKRDEN